MKLVFMGTPSFALPTLRALHEAKHEIVAVYTQPPRPSGRGQKETPSPVHAYATLHHLPVYTPQSLKAIETQATFVGHKADAAVVVAYGLLLPQPILQAYRLGCINVHPSLLPRWRGAAPIQRTVMAGDKETAIVIMQMEVGLDTGDMLMVERYKIPPGTTAGALHDTLAEKAAPLVLATLKGLENKTIKPVPQAHTGVEYAKKITKEDCIIRWNEPAEHVYNQILGLSPTPGTFFSHNNEIIKIFDATFDPKGPSAQSGTVIDERLGIACKTGVIHPTLLQRPNKKRMKVDELLNGFSHTPRQ